MRTRTDFPRAFGRSGPCPWTAPACCSFPQDSLLSAVSGWGSNSAGRSPCRPARSRLPIRKRQPLGLHAACCRFGVTQPAATPTTPAPHSPRNFSSSPPAHLPPDSRLSRQSGSRLHAVQGLRQLPLGPEQRPEKTFIGRVTRGFDFLGVDFQPGAPLAPSAVILVTPLSARGSRGRESTKTIERTKMNPTKQNHEALLRTGAMALAAAGASTAAHAATVQITFNNSFISSTSGNHLDTDFGDDAINDIVGIDNASSARVQLNGVGAALIARAYVGTVGFAIVQGVMASLGPIATVSGLVAFSLVDSGVRGGAPTLGWLDVTATGRISGEFARVEVTRFIFDDATGSAPVGVARTDAAYPEYSAASVPEPSGLGLLALGAGGLLARRRRAMAA